MFLLWFVFLTTFMYYVATNKWRLLVVLGLAVLWFCSR